MKLKLVPALLIVTAGAAGAWLPVSAQETTQASQTVAPPKSTEKAPAKKVRKVWTDDEVKTLRTPEDNEIEKEEAQSAESAAKQEPAATAEKTNKPEKKGPPAALANPKSSEDADRMIAWEDRDIAAQEEYIERVQKQLQDAPVEDQDRLRNLLQDRIKILQQTRQERKSLQQKKEEITQKPPAGDNAAESAQPPAR